MNNSIDDRSHNILESCDYPADCTDSENRIRSNTQISKDATATTLIQLEKESFVPAESEMAQFDEDVIKLDGEFDYDGYQVVRREFFAHMNEPSIAFYDYRISVNTACLNKLPMSDYVQVLVNQTNKILAIQPCQEEERNSFAWCASGNGRRKPKQITCRLFFAKIFTLMNWNPEYRYKLLGKIIHANHKYLLVFDLTATEVYQRVTIDGKRAKTSRTPVFPAEWQNQFGLAYSEHQKSMQINIFDGYAVYAIKSNMISKIEIESSEG